MAHLECNELYEKGRKKETKGFYHGCMGLPTFLRREHDYVSHPKRAEKAFQHVSMIEDKRDRALFLLAYRRTKIVLLQIGAASKSTGCSFIPGMSPNGNWPSKFHHVASTGFPSSSV